MPWISTGTLLARLAGEDYQAVVGGVKLQPVGEQRVDVVFRITGGMSDEEGLDGRFERPCEIGCTARVKQDDAMYFRTLRGACGCQEIDDAKTSEAPARQSINAWDARQEIGCRLTVPV